MIFSHVKISYFLRVFKYDFSQWPKTLYNTYVYIINLIISWGFGGEVVSALAFHLAGLNLTENFLNATRTQSSCEKSKSQRAAESREFSPGTPVSSHRES
jgi:hypothetical protein